MKGILKMENGELVVAFEVLSEFLTVNTDIEIQPKTEIRTIPLDLGDASSILSSGIDVNGIEVDFDEESYHYVSGGLKMPGELGGKGLQFHEGSYAKIKNLNLILKKK